MNIRLIYQKYPDENTCITHLESIRWADGNPVCPYCKSKNSTPVPKELRHHCNNCNTSFSVTVQTIFHHTHLPIQVWFLAVMLILNAKKGISSRQLARDLNVHKNTAWRISMKIREAMLEHWQADLLNGIVEADETYIGGKPRKNNMKNNQTPKSGMMHKNPVFGMITRGGKVKAKSVTHERLKVKPITDLIRKGVDASNATLMTDQYGGYVKMSLHLPHMVINYSICYADGEIHTNTIESFWAILKRGIIRRFHKVSLKYLPKYLDEFCYRYNQRKNAFSFDLTIQRGLGVIQ